MYNIISDYSIDPKTVRKFRILLSILKHKGKTIDELFEYSDELEKVRLERIKMNEGDVKMLPIRKCDCDGTMVRRTVNDSPGNQTGDDSKIVYTCINPKCMNQIFE